MAPLLFRSSSLAEFRAVAMTVKPLARASRATPLPKPLDAAVMSQTGGIVTVGRMLLGLEYDKGCAQVALEISVLGPIGE